MAELPDAVFSSGMMGEGIGIDPTGQTLLAPCRGTVAQLHRAHHALTLRTPEGVSILLHIGVDTVRLQGQGFTALVQEGDLVEPGQPLLGFELDTIARRAKSAVVVVVVAEGGTGFSAPRASGRVRAGRDEIATVGGTSTPESASSPSPAVDSITGRLVRISSPSGLHARPAARLVSEAKRFRSSVVVIKGTAQARATSVTELMGLGLSFGDEIQISAQGTDADLAVTSLSDLVAQGLGEDADHALALPDARRFVSDSDRVLGGVAASPGLMVGEVKLRALTVPKFDLESNTPAAEMDALERALEATQRRLLREHDDYVRRGEIEKAQIFEAHAELLTDATWMSDCVVAIRTGSSAAAAWFGIVSQRADSLASHRTALFRERAEDLMDVGHRVLRALLELPDETFETSKTTVVVSDTLTPSALASLDASRVGAFATAKGGATSHAAILARSMGVPYVAGIGSAIENLVSGMAVIVNGDEGWIRVHPDPSDLADAERAMAERKARMSLAEGLAHDPARTLDGRVIEVAANIGNAKDAELAVKNGCDGVGLLRSEFLFVNRRTEPSEDEQREQFERIGRLLGRERSLVVRTLDVGGDKPLAYMPITSEENPFLGIRGLRLSMRYPEAFAAQIRAALAAARHTKLHIMFPMVGQLDEFLRAKDLVATQMRIAQVENVSLGVMVEVPSAALLADVLAKEVDFFSIGTNDLTQYTLAIDRGHPELAAQADAVDPSVLRLIRMTCQAAHAEGKWVGVCGGLAADPLAAPLLIGLGVDELSVPGPDLPRVKAAVRAVDSNLCRRLAERAVTLTGATAVRSLLKQFAEPQAAGE